jgi:hypothetical protein
VTSYPPDVGDMRTLFTAAVSNRGHGCKKQGRRMLNTASGFATLNTKGQDVPWRLRGCDRGGRQEQCHPRGAKGCHDSRHSTWPALHTPLTPPSLILMVQQMQCTRPTVSSVTASSTQPTINSNGGNTSAACDCCCHNNCCMWHQQPQACNPVHHCYLPAPLS